MKFCTGCEQTKPETAFSFKNKAAGKRHTRCKMCVAAVNKEQYVTDPARRAQITDNNKQYKAEKLSYARGFLESGCVDCGNKDLRVLEFDHKTDTKFDGVMAMARDGYSYARIAEEIAKCDVRCKNCHAIMTYARGAWNWADAALA